MSALSKIPYKDLIKAFREKVVVPDPHIEHFAFGTKATKEDEMLRKVAHGNEHSVDPDSMTEDGIDQYYRFRDDPFSKGDAFNIHSHPGDEVAPSANDLGFFEYLLRDSKRNLINSPNFITTPYSGQYKLSSTKLLKHPEQGKERDLFDPGFAGNNISRIAHQISDHDRSLLSEYLQATKPEMKDLLKLDLDNSLDVPTLLYGKKLKDLGLAEIEYPEYNLSHGDYTEMLEDLANELHPKIEYAAGGLVAKKGLKVLQELLDNMKANDPERLKRAEEAGFDVDNIYLHGTDKDFDQFGNPENYFAIDPDLASDYAFDAVDRKYGKNKDFDFPRIIPVFLRNLEPVDAEGMMWNEAVPLIRNSSDSNGHLISNIFDNFSDDFDNASDTIAIQSNPKDIRSIFNDFTPESLADEKFAGGGLVKAGSKLLSNLEKEAKALWREKHPFDAVYVDGLEVYKNPAQRDLRSIADEDHYNSVRTLKDLESNDVYAWPASELTHDDVARKLGVGYDVEDMDNSDVFELIKNELKSKRIDTGEIFEDPSEQELMKRIFDERLKHFAPYSLMLGTAQTPHMLEYPYE